jgi:hypothetical protein
VPEPLLSQFQQRQFSVEVDIVDERTLNDVFVSSIRSVADDGVDQQQLVSLDLIELAESLLPQDFNLTSEVQKVRSDFRH